MLDITVEQASLVPVGRRLAEYVERKGTGHPDTICDGVMESISVALSRMYLESVGRVLHYNVDKGLLVAGQTQPQLGGGRFTRPIRIVLGDRATNSVDGRRLPLEEVAESAVRQWLRQHLRFVDPDKHLVIQNELQPGSSELVGIYEAGNLAATAANDTSAAVGYAPLTETEHLVLAAEHYLNSATFKHEFPDTGEDIKVMGVRRGRQLDLTVAMAFVDHHIWDEQTYFRRKAAAAWSLEEFLGTKLHALDRVHVEINTLDQPGRGLDGMYLTVLGTSAENGDGGEVGRGNRVNGLITFCRPMTLEAAAGKNPVAHVGKVYNVLAHEIAGNVYEAVEGVEEVYIWLCSKIGRPLNEPASIVAQVALAPGARRADIERPLREIIHAQFAGLEKFIERIVRGEMRVY